MTTMNGNRYPAPDVIGAGDVRKILGGISRERLRQILRDHPDFPAHTQIAAPMRPCRVWDRASVVAWQQARTRPRRRAMYVLLTQYARNGGRIGAAARSAGIHTSTARRWLRELGTPLPRERNAHDG